MKGAFARHAALLAFLCVACASQPIVGPPATEAVQPQPSPNWGELNTSLPSFERATLPPTWTPTAYPTESPIPSPTPSPSATPPPSLTDLCDSLVLNYLFPDDALFSPSDELLIFFGTPLRVWASPVQVVTPTALTGQPPFTDERQPLLLEPVVVRLIMTRLETGEVFGGEAPGGEVVGLQLPLSQLPGPGQYNWTVSIVVPSLGPQCEYGGTFTLGEERRDRGSP
ncbi:MAG: hypothetical protein SNJ59_12255 [Aggregatilineales bacterium]